MQNTHNASGGGDTIIVTVSGACAGVGKTRLVESLLALCPGAVAVKVQARAEGDVRVVEEMDVTESPQKDTGRYLAAGAGAAFLLSGAPQDLPPAARRLIEAAGARVLIFETNSLALELRPDVAFFVDGPGPIKPCLLYTSPSPRDLSTSRMPSSA